MRTQPNDFLAAASVVLGAFGLAMLVAGLFFVATLRQDIEATPKKFAQARAENLAMERRFGNEVGLTPEQRLRSPLAARLYDFGQAGLDFGEENFHLFYKIRAGMCLVGAALLGTFALIARAFSRRGPKKRVGW